MTVLRAVELPAAEPVRTVLVVSGDQDFLSAVLATFQDDTTAILAARSAEEARFLMAGTPVRAVIIDETLRDQRGLDLLIEFSLRHPSVPRSFATTDVDLAKGIRLVNQARIFRLLKKPWDYDAVGATIRTGPALHRTTVS